MSADPSSEASDRPQLVDPLAAHRLDADLLADWLRERLNLASGPLSVRQFQGGMSNPTYLLTDAGGARYVLRKKPPGKLLPRAHAVDREYRVMNALAGTAAPAPKMLVYCDDASIIGSEFYVMEFVDGRIVTSYAMEPVARERGVELLSGDFSGLPEDGPMVRGDRDQLSQAIGNLIENALKYGGGKPVRVFPAAPDPARPGMVGLTVADRGEGIAREHLPRLTERFYRVSAKRSRDQGGTGLGLAIVHRIIDAHGGAVEVGRSPLGGARVALLLPLDAEQALEPTTEPIEAPAGRDDLPENE